MSNDPIESTGGNADQEWPPPPTAPRINNNKRAPAPLAGQAALFLSILAAACMAMSYALEHMPQIPYRTSDAIVGCILIGYPVGAFGGIACGIGSIDSWQGKAAILISGATLVILFNALSHINMC